MADPRGERWRGLAAGIALIACLALFVSYGIEWVENEIDLGYGEEARRDSYLAAAMFLNSRGIESEAVAGLSLLDDLPPVSDTILMSTSRRALSERRQADLFAWVAAGGNLVSAAEEVFDPDRGESRDAFLDRVGIYLNDPADADPADADREAQAKGPGATPPDAGEGPNVGDEELPRTLEAFLEEALSGELSPCESDEDRLAYMRVDGLPELLQLELSSGNFLSVGDSEWLEAASRSGAQLVRVPVQSGWVSAATSTDIWTNSRIHCHDHAYLLWLFTRGSAKVWMLHDPELLSLADLLAASFPLTLTGFVGLLLVWAAARSLRFGPVHIEELDERRQLLEHLQATADFWWRGALLRAPLDALRADLRQRAGRASGGQAAVRDDSTRRIAEIAHLPEQDVEFALSADALAKKRDFVKAMQILGMSRRHL